MNIIQLIKVVTDLLNGKKLNTGTVIIVLVFIFSQLGIDKTEATQIATSIMLGIGGVMTIWGYIHRVIKDMQKKNAEKK
jgi:hypothetical protein